MIDGRRSLLWDLVISLILIGIATLGFVITPAYLFSESSRWNSRLEAAASGDFALPKHAHDTVEFHGFEPGLLVLDLAFGSNLKIVVPTKAQLYSESRSGRSGDCKGRLLNREDMMLELMQEGLFDACVIRRDVAPPAHALVVRVNSNPDIYNSPLLNLYVSGFGCLKQRVLIADVYERVQGQETLLTRMVAGYDGRDYLIWPRSRRYSGTQVERFFDDDCHSDLGVAGRVYAAALLAETLGMKFDGTDRWTGARKDPGRILDILKPHTGTTTYAYDAYNRALADYMESRKTQRK